MSPAQCDQRWLPGLPAPGITGVSVNALALLPSGDVLAGGVFGTSGSTYTYGISRYNPTTRSWSALGRNLQSVSSIAVTATGESIIAGNFPVIDSEYYGSIARYNPTTGAWSKLGTGTEGGEVRAVVVLPNGDVIAAGSFFRAGGVITGGFARYRPSTNAWARTIASGVPEQNFYSAVLHPSGAVYAGGSFTSVGGINAICIARYDPALNSWSPLGDGTNGSVLKMAVDPSGDLFVAGTFTRAGSVNVNGFARYNPTTNAWSAVAQGPINGTGAVATARNGDLIVGGTFTQVGGNVVPNIARYNPVSDTWATMDVSILGAIGSVVSSIIELPNGDVIAGGTFDNAGDVQLKNIARFDATVQKWVPLNPGLSGIGGVIAPLPDGDVVVAGQFSQPTKRAAAQVSRLRTATGERFVLGTSGEAASSASAIVRLSNGDLIVGGNFLTLNGVVVNRIARFESAAGTWSPLGSGPTGVGTSGPIYAIAIAPNGDIIAAGAFTSAGGLSANNIARYSVSTGVWSPMGSGLTRQLQATVRSLVVLPGGDVIAAGQFDTAGSSPVNNIARFQAETSAWSGLAGGITGNFGVFDLLLLPDGSLVAAGDFSAAGGVGATSLARFDFLTNTWSNLGNGLSGRVNDVALLANGDLILAGRCQVGSQGYWNLFRYNIASHQWYADGSVFGAEPMSLALFPDGQICASGTFFGTGFECSPGFARFAAPAPVILSNPEPTIACPAAPARISIRPAAGLGPFEYQWRQNGVAINDNPSAQTDTLIIPSALAADRGTYDCIVTNACGSVTSLPAALTVCAADFNCDGGVDGGDIESFFTRWADGDAAADTNADGGVDGDDVRAFFEAWMRGGC
ncbi:MAG: hypothetical protein JSR77_01265 [Planctomycetes bacterium]|nr:hypothetical protein [Planctomycetota bacterium]